MAAGLLAFFVALFVSLLLTVPVRALALRVGMVDLPGPRKVHLEPIPLLGGLSIYLGFLIGALLVFRGPALAQIEGILAGATLIIAVRSEEHTSELQSQFHLVCRLLLEKKKKTLNQQIYINHKHYIT